MFEILGEISGFIILVGLVALAIVLITQLWIPILAVVIVVYWMDAC